MSVALALAPVAFVAFMETEPEFETVLPLDPDEAADAEEDPTDVTEVLAELGGSWSSGNTENVVLNSSLIGSKRKGDNRISAEAIADLGRAMDDDDGDGTISDAERSNGFQLNEQELSFEGRYDRFLTETDIGYATTGWLNDPFSGYRSRIHQQVGYGRVLVQTEETSPHLRGGPRCRERVVHGWGRSHRGPGVRVSRFRRYGAYAFRHHAFQPRDRVARQRREHR